MLTTGTQNLPEPLARVQAAYHGTARLAPASADRLARRVEHFASSDDRESRLPGRPVGPGPACAPSPPEGSLAMMHVMFSLISADPRVLAGCIGYLEDEARPVLESQHGSLGVSLLEGSGVVISESFWATHAALWLSQEIDAELRGELARRVQRPVAAKDYQVAVFERESPPGQAVRLTRVEVKPAAVPDVVHVYGDTAVPWLADTPGFCETLLFADPEGGELISQTGWRDPAAQAASPSVAEIIRSNVLADDDCQIRAVEDYHLVFCSARKPGPA